MNLNDEERAAMVEHEAFMEKILICFLIAVMVAVGAVALSSSGFDPKQETKSFHNVVMVGSFTPEEAETKCSTLGGFDPTASADSNGKVLQWFCSLPVK